MSYQPQDISLRKWVEDKPKRGHYFFTHQDVQDAFPNYTDKYLRTAIFRIKGAGLIVAPTYGFYVVVPTEYALKGIVPPAFYIDAMMNYVDTKYYIGLLNAAAYYGATHQQPQTFSVILEGTTRRTTTQKGTSIEYFSKKEINDGYIRLLPTKTGNIRISSAELTAIDLIAYEQRIGGLNRVTTVLNDMVDSLDFSKADSLIKKSPIRILQRLGYIMDVAIGETDLAQPLYDYLKGQKQFRKTLLKAGGEPEGSINEKWKIVENIEIEIDE